MKKKILVLSLSIISALIFTAGASVSWDNEKIDSATSSVATTIAATEKSAKTVRAVSVTEEIEPDTAAATAEKAVEQAAVVTTAAETTTKAPAVTTTAEATTKAPVVTTTAEATTKAPAVTTTAEATTKASVTTTVAEPTTTTAKAENVTDSVISASKAFSIALKDAGFEKSEVYDKDIELDREKGVLIYEVSFEKDNIDYDYYINAQSGDIIRSKTDQPVTTQRVTTTVPSENIITYEQAEKIALDSVSLKAKEVFGKEIELDREKGVLVYEVSFEKGNVEYDIIINAQNGEILRSETEID